MRTSSLRPPSRRRCAPRHPLPGARATPWPRSRTCRPPPPARAGHRRDAHQHRERRRLRGPALRRRGCAALEGRRTPSTRWPSPSPRASRRRLVQALQRHAGPGPNPHPCEPEQPVAAPRPWSCGLQLAQTWPGVTRTIVLAASAGLRASVEAALQPVGARAPEVMKCEIASMR